MNKYIISLIGIIFLLQACDFMGGLIRYAILEGSPLNHECVQKALDSVEGISDISYSQPEFYKGRRHRFDYLAGSIRNNLIFEPTYDDSVINKLLGMADANTSYWNGYSFLNTVPELEDIYSIRPLLIEIDRAVERECNTEIGKYIQEECKRIECTFDD